MLVVDALSITEGLDILSFRRRKLLIVKTLHCQNVPNTPRVVKSTTIKNIRTGISNPTYTLG